MAKSSKSKNTKQAQPRPLAVHSGSLPLQNFDGREILPANQYKSLALRSMFWRPDYLQGSSAWVEHLPFAFWIIEALQPALFVELGTHYGHSYFSFCQAIKRLGLNTPSYAVDTWKGDDQAGMYGESVYQQVAAYNQANYPEFSSLLRCTFDEAQSRFADGSIDLLHIDGFHTYEAVRHDFESWLPKLSDRAVVLFHDTNVRRDDFGVYKYFAELTSKYPHFEFIHGHGLGVLGVGKEQPELLQSLYTCYAHQPSRNIVYELFSRLGRSCHDLMDLNAEREAAQQIREESSARHQHIVHLEQIAHQRSTEIEHLTGELGRVSEEIQTRASQIAHLESVVGERDSEIERLNGEVFRLTEEAVRTESLRGQLEQAVAEKAAEVKRLTAEIARMSEERIARHEHIGHLEQIAGERGSEIERLNGEVTRLTEEAILAESLRGQLEQTVAEKAAEVERLIEDLKASLQSITEMKWYVGERDQWVSELRKETEELALVITERDADIKLLKEDINRLSEERQKQESVSVDQLDEILRLQNDLSEKSETLDRYIQESAQMGRMIIEAQNEGTAKQGEIDRLRNEIKRVNEESTARANHILHLEQVAGERGAEVERLSDELARVKEEGMSRLRHLEETTKSKITEVERLNGEVACLVEDVASITEQKLHLEQVAGERGAEVREISEKLSYKSDELNRCIQESALMAHMIIDAQNECDAWKKINVQVDVKEVITGPARTVDQHQHINFTLKEIKHLGRFFSRLDVRIVNHLGNPGFVIFEPIVEERPLYAWERHGEENGKGYMLIIPSDKNGEEWLVKATSNDLILTRDVIIIIKQSLIKANNIKWIKACDDIIYSIDNIPLRLHYDDILIKEKKKNISVVKLINPLFKTLVVPETIMQIERDKIISITHQANGKIIEHENKKGFLKDVSIFIRKEEKNILFHLNKNER